MSRGYSILSRNEPKIWKINDRVIIGSAGMQADCQALTTRLGIHHDSYKDRMGRDMTANTASRVVSNTLYYKRFFPFYCFNLVGGVDDDEDSKEEEVKGYLYTYDAIGSFESVEIACEGSGVELIMPLLDFVKLEKQAGRFIPTRENVEKLVIDCFHMAAEKDIYTGDQIELYTVTKGGIDKKMVPIRCD